MPCHETARTRNRLLGHEWIIHDVSCMSTIGFVVLVERMGSIIGVIELCASRVRVNERYSEVRLR